MGDKLPAIQFYPGDWHKDPGIKALTLEEKGAWFEMLLLMHESEVRGKLMLNGLPYPDEALGIALGVTTERIKQILSKLQATGVASVEQNTGIMFNRRMLRDNEIREKRAKSGSIGGSKTQANLKQISSSSSSSSSSSTETDRKPRKVSSPEQPTADSVAAIPSALQGLRLYETDRKLIERLPELLVEWGGAYPGVQILWEIKKAHAWESSHPKRRKKNHISFLNNWLSRAQNEASRTVRGTPFVPTVEDPNRSNCPHCGGTKELAGGVENGRITRIPCRYCSPVETPENQELKAKGENLISETLGKAFRKANP